MPSAAHEYNMIANMPFESVYRLQLESSVGILPWRKGYCRLSVCETVLVPSHCRAPKRFPKRRRLYGPGAGRARSGLLNSHPRRASPSDRLSIRINAFRSTLGAHGRSLHREEYSARRAQARWDVCYHVKAQKHRCESSTNIPPSK